MEPFRGTAGFRIDVVQYWPCAVGRRLCFTKTGRYVEELNSAAEMAHNAAEAGAGSYFASLPGEEILSHDDLTNDEARKWFENAGRPVPENLIPPVLRPLDAVADLRWFLWSVPAIGFELKNRYERIGGWLALRQWPPDDALIAAFADERMPEEEGRLLREGDDPYHAEVGTPEPPIWQANYGWGSLLWDLRKTLREWSDEYRRFEFILPYIPERTFDDPSKPIADRWLTNLRKELNNVFDWTLSNRDGPRIGYSVDGLRDFLLAIETHRMPNEWTQQLQGLYRHDDLLRAVWQRLNDGANAAGQAATPIAGAGAPMEQRNSGQKHDRELTPPRHDDIAQDARRQRDGHIPLSERQNNILQALLEENADSPQRKLTAAEIANKVEGKYANPNQFKAPLAQLVNPHGLLSSKGGREGGCWLTTKGKAYAQGLFPKQ